LTFRGHVHDVIGHVTIWFAISYRWSFILNELKPLSLSVSEIFNGECRNVTQLIRVILADRSRLCCSVSSVVCLSVTLCIVTKQCVLEQKLGLLLTAYRKSYKKSIGTKMQRTTTRLQLLRDVLARPRALPAAPKLFEEMRTRHGAIFGDQ